MPRYAIGFDFGDDSLRVVGVDVRTGQIAGRAEQSYSGALEAASPMQHPQVWFDAAARACRDMIDQSALAPHDAIGIGVAVARSWVIPCLHDGTPLCLKRAPQSVSPAQIRIDAGDWIVWQLIGGPSPHCTAESIVRSTCGAGFRAIWKAKTGYPSPEFPDTPALADPMHSIRAGKHAGPGTMAGNLTPRCARLFGLRSGIAVSSAILSSHARVAGCGVASPSTMVMVLGPDAIHLLNSRIEATPPGITGVVEGGILPGYFGYEIAQSPVGDALERMAGVVNIQQEELDRTAARLPPGSGGISATASWRTALLAGNLRDAFAGSTLDTHPSQMYRALTEAIAFELRSICEDFRAAGVPVRRFVADGELPKKSPLLMQTYADVLDARIKLAQSDQTVALGAAILGCVAAGTQATGHASMSQAIHAMAPHRHDVIYRPDLRARKAYDKLYAALWPFRETGPGA